MRKVLVTGAAGFIGSHLLRRLLRENHSIGVIEKEGADFHRISNLETEIAIFNVDLQNILPLRKAILEFRPWAIIHLAAHYAVDHRPEELSAMLETNVHGTMNILEAAKETGVKLVINTSSCFVYAMSDAPLAEKAPLSPLNLYALTKIQAEQACEFYAGRYGLQVVTCRLFPPYGPDDHERRLIPTVIKAFMNGESPPLTTGRQRWDFTYVEDIVDAYISILKTEEFSSPHEIFNLGTGRAVSVRDVITRITELLGIKPDLRWGSIPHREREVWHLQADNTKAVTKLNWQPDTDILDDGLSSVIDSYKTTKQK